MIRPLAALLLLAALGNSYGFTLERLKGDALLGQALQVSIIARYSPGEDVSANCFTADVQYGEQPQANSAVSTLEQPGGVSNVVEILVKSPKLVDEPVVSVNLKAACALSTSRRFVMLSEYATPALEPAAPQPRDAPQKPSGTVAAVAANAADKPMDAAAAKSAAGASDADAGTGSAAAPAKVRAAQRSAEKTARKSSKRANAASAASAAAAGSSAKPKLAPAPMAAEIAQLQLRIDAVDERAAALSKPEVLAQQEQKLKDLQEQLAGLQQLGKKNQDNVQAMTQALEQASSQSYSASLGYALLIALLLLLALLGLGFYTLRSGRMRDLPWWKQGGADAPATAAAQAVPANLAVPEVSATASTAQEPPQNTVLDLEIDVDLGASIFSGLDASPSPAVPSALPKPAPVPSLPAYETPLANSARPLVNTKEMLDIRQQAEFFMALGQYEEAIKVLETSIHASDAANPLLFLDLLKILHTLGRRTSFESYRGEFNLHFSANVPPYERFLNEGQGLEAYETLCAQLVALWPSGETLHYIEHCLVRASDATQAGLDLEAFRDLLMLHAILGRLLSPEESAPMPFSASRLVTVHGESSLGAGPSTVYGETSPSLLGQEGSAQGRTASGEAARPDISLNDPLSDLDDFRLSDLG